MGSIVEYKIDSKRHEIILNFKASDIKHDRDLIERSFDDFKDDEWADEADMKAKFEK